MLGRGRAGGLEFDEAFMLEAGDGGGDRESFAPGEVSEFAGVKLRAIRGGGTHFGHEFTAKPERNRAYRDAKDAVENEEIRAWEVKWIGGSATADGEKNQRRAAEILERRPAELWKNPVVLNVHPLPPARGGLAARPDFRGSSFAEKLFVTGKRVRVPIIELRFFFGAAGGGLVMEALF